MSHLLLVFVLLGTVCSEEFSGESGEINEDDPNHDMLDNLETSSLSDCQLDKYYNVTLNHDKDVCPDKETCSYRIFCRRRRFGRAQRICRCNRGNLASIHNVCVNRAIAQGARRVNSHLIWIGVRKPRCGGYRNVDGSRLDYTNWACGQQKGRGKWCVALHVNSGQWYSVRCATRLPFVCAI